MISSFKDPETEKVFHRYFSKKLPPVIQTPGYRKLAMLHSARKLLDLRSPPGNRLESLKGDRAGQWSIRFDDQWRVCFEWEEDGAYNVEITDYHS